MTGVRARVCGLQFGTVDLVLGLFDGRNRHHDVPYPDAQVQAKTLAAERR